MISRRLFLGSACAAQTVSRPPETRYDAIRWIEERDDPSLTLDTGHLVVRVIDNTGLRSTPGKHPLEHAFTHHLGYHGIRALWRKDERRNVVMPFVSWLNLQNLLVEGLELDPVDDRALFGVGRGWPVTMARQGESVELTIPAMPLSGVEYALRIGPQNQDFVDFEVRFILHKKNRSRAAFRASWPCYMSTYDEVALYVPTANAESPDWRRIGETEPVIIGDPVNYSYSQRTFEAPPAAIPLAYGRIGSRVLAIMVSRPEVTFFLVNAGGHLSFLPVQNPAWDLSFKLPDYEPGRPFGFHGRIIYKAWEGPEDILTRYRQFKEHL